MTVSHDGTSFTATNDLTGEAFSSEKAWATFDRAMAWSTPGGVVSVEPGLYPVGEARTLAHDARWIADHGTVAVINGVVGREDGSASEIIVASNPGSGTLIAHMNFPAAWARAEIAKIGAWILPSHTFSDRGVNDDANGSPFRIVLDDTLGCTSPEWKWEIYHPEWVEAEWKWYSIQNSPGVGSELPRSPSTVRCIGLEWFDNPSLALPSFPYGITIDDIRGTVDESWIEVADGVSLRGAGPLETILQAVPGLNHHLVTVGAGSSVSYLQIDGTIDDQQAIDYAPGIYNGSGDGAEIHHTYIHHTRGAGIHVRGDNIKIFENWVEWTENAQVNVGTGFPSGTEIYNNTLRYGLNDGNIWLIGAINSVVEGNDLYSLTDQLIATAPDVPEGVTSGRGFVPFTAKDNAAGWIFRGNRIVEAGSYGMQFNVTSFGTVENNIVSKPGRHGIVMFSDVNNLRLLGNLIEDSALSGIKTTGSGHVISGNATRNSGRVGFDLSGSKQTGTANYSTNGQTDAACSGCSVEFASSQPAEPVFASGSSWSPHGEVDDGAADPSDGSGSGGSSDPVDELKTATFSASSDTYIRQARPDAGASSALRLNVDGSDPGTSGQAVQTLMRFAVIGTDTGQIPPGSTIVSAMLTVESVGPSATGARLHRLLQPWSENATWDKLSGGISPDDAEAASHADAVLGRTGTGPKILDVSSAVQAWSDGAPEHGWAFVPSGNDGWDFLSRESGKPPVLKVSFRAPAVASSSSATLGTSLDIN